MSTISSHSVITKQYRLYFILLVFCFMLWGTINSMTDSLTPAFAKIFMIKAVDSSLVQVFFYGSYAFLAIPAAIIIRKYSYRAGVLVGLGLYIIGASGYIPAALLQNYHVFLISIFILAGGCAILETACDPFVLYLGSQETSVRRLNLAQAFNPMGGIIGVFFAKYVILSHLNPATLDERFKMTAQELSSIRTTELFWVCVPYVGLIVLSLLVWFLFLRSKFKEKEDEVGMPAKVALKRLFHNKRYMFGLLSQFMYVGAQTAVWTWTIKYIMEARGLIEADAADIFVASMILFILFRWLCTYLMKFFAPVKIMMVFAFLAIIFSLFTVYLPGAISEYFLIAISACMSLMFPTIYGLALRNMGQEVKFGAAGLVMCVVGGAIITPIMGWFVDTGALNFMVTGYRVAEASIRTAFFLPIVCFVIILIYSVSFRKS
ncbi:L-fucose:H+ symporter permease [Klebsiella indica]|uniref:L-fucose:H+ symporter permease n=1 Tax=Klebsiella indica TaxID=2582917 RepID=A0A5R9L8D2_9ENTR|nr:L-fucose:H+ symporter permease [Klebsiella indica]TLV04897.1 L-fucose:H+ symporter permease [Klebsiella indica]